ncbi:hypothetical protein AZOA_29710 [Azoarcus sp. Aa7]|nr:hypothetical protein [Azoarcus sp. Aa7]
MSATPIPAAHAFEYSQVQSDKSNVAFDYKQMGVAMYGQFKKLSGQLSFDPAQASNAKVAFDVDPGSIDTGSSEYDSEVAGKLRIKGK